MNTPAGSEWIVIIGFLVILGISILIFLVLREFWVWYFKTNQIIKILENQTELMNEIIEVIKNDKNE